MENTLGKKGKKRFFDLYRPDVKGFPELIVAVMTKKCPPIPEHLSDTAKDFIKQCCQFDKKLRPRTDKLLLHPFLAGHA